MAKQISPTTEFTTLARFNPNTGSLGTAAARHPYRYFIAGGETLQLIEDALSNAIAHPANMRTLADLVGADTITEYNRFFFTDSTVDKPAPVIKLAIHDEQFIADAQTPNRFLPNPHAHNSAYLHDKLSRLQSATDDDAATQKADLCKETRASDIIDGHFVFNDADRDAQQIVFTPPPRLSANPLFIMPGKHPRGFAPDASMPAGLAITRLLNELSAQKFPLQSVMKALGCWEVNTDPHGHPRFKDDAGRPNDKYSGKCEKIGNEWIVAVPVIGAGRYGANGEGGSLSGYQEEITVPPGSTPLPIADYFARLEKAGMLSFAGPNAVPAPK